MLYLPFSYTFLTRNRTKPYKIAYLLTYLIPLMIIMCYFHRLSILCLVSLIGTVSVYEAGYIENDNVTVMYEQDPTVRLMDKDQEWVRRRLPVLCSFRRSYAFLAFVILYISRCKTVWLYAFLIMGLDITYAVHNVIRSRWNCLTLGVLTFLKYLAPVIVCASGPRDVANMSICILVLCSAVRVVEHANKYHVYKNILLVKYDYFRMSYYLAVFLVSSVAWSLFKQGQLLFWLSAYFLVYRSFCVLLIGKKKTYNLEEKNLG